MRAALCARAARILGSKDAHRSTQDQAPPPPAMARTLPTALSAGQATTVGAPLCRGPLRPAPLKPPAPLRSERRSAPLRAPLRSADVALQEALVEVVADGVVDKALLGLGLAARLVLEHDVVVPSAPPCSHGGMARGTHGAVVSMWGGRAAGLPKPPPPPPATHTLRMRACVRACTHW